jgi:hypothetical protein
MFSGTHTTIFVVVALAFTLAVPSAAAAASGTISPSVDADQEATADVLDAGALAQENTTTTTDGDGANNSSGPSIAEAAYGILTADREDPTEPTFVIQTLRDGVLVTGIEYRDGYALLEVVNLRPRAVTLDVTDSNSIDTDGGSGLVSHEQYTLPQGRFELKVPASVERGDQTITVGVGERLYYFSDQSGGSAGLLAKVGAGWVPWALGGATMFTYVVGVAYVVLAGEDTGVREAGGTL